MASPSGSVEPPVERTRLFPAKTAPFTYQYTVTDAQAATQTITVTEKLTNGTQTITLRTYTATSGAQNTVDLSSVWLPLLSGSNISDSSFRLGETDRRLGDFDFLGSLRDVEAIAQAIAFRGGRIREDVDKSVRLVGVTCPVYGFRFFPEPTS